MRDHEPLTIDQFNGLWARDPIDACPYDHWTNCANVTLLQAGFKVRNGLDVYLPFADTVRIYTYTKTSSQSLLILDGTGHIYDSGSPTPQVPIYTNASMTDFSMVSLNGRAYFSPSDGTSGLGGVNIQVYKGAGAASRDAGGAAPVNGGTPFAGAASATAGNVEAGIHLYAVVYETDTGFLTAPGPVGLFVNVTSDGTKKVDLSHIPTGPTYITKRHIIATKAIQDWNNDQTGFQFFFVPNGVINDNTTATLTVNFYDADLLSDASYLINLFSVIPAGVGLSVYHNRMVSWGENASPTVVRLSTPGEPEAIDQVNGLLQSPVGSKTISSCEEYRDVLYVNEQNKTYAYMDNQSDPATWSQQIIDRGLGSVIHGVGTILDTSGASIELLLVMNTSGIFIFNGLFQYPELTWKIKDFWLRLTDYNKFQILIDSINQLIYVNLLNSTLLVGDFSQGLSATTIRWTKWVFNVQTSTIAFVNTNELILGSSTGANPNTPIYLIKGGVSV